MTSSPAELSECSEAAAEPPAPRGNATIWRQTAGEIHDLLWASRCIQVVRNGSPRPVEREGPALYLLLTGRQLVHFPLDTILKRMHWSAPRLLRLRVVVHDPIDYTEHIDGGDRGVVFRRSYRRPVQRSERVWITADPALAAVWTNADSPSAARAALRTLVDRDAVESIKVEGESSGFRGPADEYRWLSIALKHWDKPNSVLPEVYAYQSGVWAHETAEIAPTARIYGRVWIGAGKRVPDRAVIVGPVIVPDAEGGALAGRLPPIDWTLVRSPHWALPSLTGGGTVRRAVKRGFDIVFSLAVLAVTVPFYPLVMLAIAVEDGTPFFFAHRRQTLGGREFPCLKFRTMRRDAEKIKAELMTVNAADGPQFFMENDPRVTAVGRFLRRFQIDELPQFINVLLGHMSVVGPRPSPDKENQYCPAWREARLSVRPGVTGLWQVSRTREPQTDFQEWIRYDLEYVQHQSFIGDLRIIIRTIRTIIKI